MISEEMAEWPVEPFPSEMPIEDLPDPGPCRNCGGEHGSAQLRLNGHGSAEVQALAVIASFVERHSVAELAVLVRVADACAMLVEEVVLEPEPEPKKVNRDDGWRFSEKGGE